MDAAPDMPLPQLANPEVRDLAWACFSTPLVDAKRLASGPPALGNCALGLDAARTRWLQALDAEPEPLRAFLGPARRGRLGLYFERLWQFFLSRDPAVELIAHNLAVRDGGRTLGEFDLLYYCHKRRCHVHLELAVKFYLQQPGSSGEQWRHWIGPNVRDRLDRKLERLLSHQLQLADRDAARPLLRQHGIARVRRELAMRGRLFCAADAATVPAAARPVAQPVSRYYDCDQLRRHTAAGKRFQLLQRCEWFAPVSSAPGADCSDASSLADTIEAAMAAGGRPLQVAALDGAGVERERFFVVPDAWLAQARSA